MLPAHAGMIRFAIRRTEVLEGAPRACGDDPWPVYIKHITAKVLPAHAGMIRQAPSWRWLAVSAPRACGDDPKPGRQLGKP